MSGKQNRIVCVIYIILAHFWIVQIGQWNLQRKEPGKSNWKGRLSTVDLLARTSLDQLLWILIVLFIYFKTSFLNEEVNCTEPSPTVSIPWTLTLAEFAESGKIISFGGKFKMTQQFQGSKGEADPWRFRGKMKTWGQRYKTFCP